MKYKYNKKKIKRIYDSFDILDNDYKLNYK